MHFFVVPVAVQHPFGADVQPQILHGFPVAAVAAGTGHGHAAHAAADEPDLPVPLLIQVFHRHFADPQVIVFHVIDGHVAGVDAHDVGDARMQQAKKRFGQGPHHDQPVQARVQKSVQHRLIFQFLLRMDQRDHAA